MLGLESAMLGLTSATPGVPVSGSRASRQPLSGFPSDEHDPSWRMVVVAATEGTRPSQGAVGELMRRPAHDVVEIGMFERMVPRAEVGQIG